MEGGGGVRIQNYPQSHSNGLWLLVGLVCADHAPSPLLPPPLQGFFRKRKTTNLEAYVNWFNRLSYLVATEICLVGAEQTGGDCFEGVSMVTDAFPPPPRSR